MTNCWRVCNGSPLQRATPHNECFLYSLWTEPSVIYQVCSHVTKFSPPLIFPLTLLPPATKLGQGYVFTGVCHSVNRGVGGVYLSACWDTHPPRSRHAPLGADTLTPLGADTPPEQTPPGVDTPQRSRHPPGEDTTHPGADTPLTSMLGRYCRRAGGTHPTGMQSCFVMVNRIFGQMNDGPFCTAILYPNTK